MRFKELKILEAETPAERRARRNGQQPAPSSPENTPTPKVERKVYAVGDSLGVGLKSANNIPGEAVGGYNPEFFTIPETIDLGDIAGVNPSVYDMGSL
jgi:hypothetical protein